MLLVLDAIGTITRAVPGKIASYGAQGIALGPGRRHAFVAIPMGERPWRLYQVDLGTGSTRMLANGISPSVSPDGIRLAFLRTGLPRDSRGNTDILRVTALVIRNLRTGHSYSIPFRPSPPLGTPPELIINWSPDGKRIALFDGTRIRLVTPASAPTIASQPPARGTVPTSSHTGSLAPVFLDPDTLVVLDGCCIGSQQLTAINLRSGRAADSRRSLRQRRTCAA